MSYKTKRRWYQFSLGAFFIVLTLFCLLLGRIDYLKRKAKWHIDEAARQVEKIQTRHGLSENDAWGYAEFAGLEGITSAWFGPPEHRFQLVPADDVDTRAVRRHLRLAEEFESAVSRSWLPVDESERIEP